MSLKLKKGHNMSKKSRQQNKPKHVNKYARNSSIVDTMNSAAQTAGISITEAEQIVRGTLKGNAEESHREFVREIGGNDELKNMREKFYI